MSRIRQVLSWDPPLWVGIPVLCVVTVAVSFAVGGEVGPSVFVLIAACAGAMVGRRRRLQRRVAPGVES